MSASWSKKVKGKRFTVEEYALHLIQRYGSGANKNALRLARRSTHDHTRFWYFAVAAEIRWRKCNGSGAQDRIDHREISAEEHAFLMLSRYGTRAREYALDRMGRAALEDTRQHYAVVAERIPEIRELFTESKA